MKNHNELRPNLETYKDILCKYGNLSDNLSKGKAIWSIALYVRLSKDDGNSVSLSIVNQIKKHARALRSMEDFILYDIYIDDGKTGTDFEREEFIRMQDDIKNKIVNCVIVIDLTRYARNLADGIKELDAFVLEHKIRFISLNIPEIDTLKDPTAISSPAVYQALSAAEDFARTTSKKVRDIKEIKRIDGEKNGGFPPYGFLSEKDCQHWLIDPVASEVVKQIFLWSSQAMSDNSIAKKLNEIGVPNPTKHKQQLGLKYSNPRAKNNSGLWWPTTVRRILSDKTNLGFMVQGKTSSFDHKRHKQIAKKKEEYIEVADCNPQIIDNELYSHVEEMRKIRMRATKKTGLPHLFAGLVYCSSCGLAMKKTSSKGIDYLCCRVNKDLSKERCPAKRTIQMKELEDIILKAIQSQISLVIDLQKIVKKVNESSKTINISQRIEQLLESKNKEFSMNENMLDSSYFDWKHGDITQEQYSRVREKIEKDLLQLRTSINELLKQRQKISKGISNTDDYFKCFLKYKNIEVLNKTILHELISRIYVNEDKTIKIEFKYSNQYLLILDFINNNKVCKVNEEADKVLTKKR